MKEAIGNTEAVRSLKHIGFWAHKLPDVMGGRFTDSKPFDIVACSPKGRFISIEGKMTKKWEGFSAKKLREHQVVNLDATGVKRGGRAFVFLYVRIKADKKKNQPRVTKLVVFDWKKYRARLLGAGFTAQEMRTIVGTQGIDTFTHEGKLHYALKGFLK